MRQRNSYLQDENNLSCSGVFRQRALYTPLVKKPVTK